MSSPFEPGPEPTEPAEPPHLHEWGFRGLILAPIGETGPRVKGGVLALADLERFVRRVRAEMPGAAIVCHEYGLRAIDSVSSPAYFNGPKLDWSDWD